MKKEVYKLDDNIDFFSIEKLFITDYNEDNFIEIHYDNFLYIKLTVFCPFKLEQSQKRYNLYVIWQHRDGYEDTMIWQDFDKASELIRASEKIHKAIKKHLNAGFIIPKEKIPIFIKNAYEA